ncbi:MAG: EAL and HDOD domain-containing protein [Acidobacteriota bacterium]
MSDLFIPQPQEHAGRLTSRTATPAVAPTRFLGRQPILSSDRSLFGYELLYRERGGEHFSGDPDRATREVVDHWLMLIPDAHQGVAFVNCPASAIVNEFVSVLDPEATVLEILEDVEPEPAVLDACLSLKAKGYRFALDGYLPRPSRAPFLALADFIKIDFQTANFFDRQAIYALAKGTSARLVAEKIESETQMRIALSEGCSLFQGYFFSEPTLTASSTVPQNHFVYLQLLAELHQESPNLRKIEKLVAGDAALCYRVLRIANSALRYRRGEVNTVHEALMMIGENALRHLMTVSMTGAATSDRCSALLQMILTRARFLELIAPKLGRDSAEMYFLGMLSLLDVLLQVPFGRILESIPIGQAMKQALAGDNSSSGLALALVRSLESCDWKKCDTVRLDLSLSESDIAAAYTTSLHWAASMSGEGIPPSSGS